MIIDYLRHDIHHRDIFPNPTNPSSPSFNIQNQRAWKNPTPTPWGKEREYLITLKRKKHRPNVFVSEF